MGPVERRSWFLAAAVLAIASAAVLTALDSAETIPSVIRNPLSDFVEPGVSVWWFVLGGPFRSAPSSPAGIALAAAANSALWLLMVLFVVAVVRVIRKRIRMPSPTNPVAIVAAEAPLRSKPSNYPEPFASQMAGRRKRPLGDLFGLANFGVNLTQLAPGAVSALRHAHTKQDEFVYILQGYPTLRTDEGRTRLSPGMCAGFKAGSGNGHHLINETEESVLYLEVGDRTPGDEGSYPDDDLKARIVDGKWKFVHKDDSPY